MDSATLVNRLRYQGRQYSNGEMARGGAPTEDHFLTQAADRIEEFVAANAKLQGQIDRVGEFPAVLRKMWSGSEVATWIDDAIDNTHEEKSNG